MSTPALLTPASSTPRSKAPAAKSNSTTQQNLESPFANDAQGPHPFAPAPLSCWRTIAFRLLLREKACASSRRSPSLQGSCRPIARKLEPNCSPQDFLDQHLSKFPVRDSSPCRYASPARQLQIVRKTTRRPGPR